MLNDVKSNKDTGMEKYIMYDKSAQVMENVTQLINSHVSIFRPTKKVKQKKARKTKYTKQVCIEQPGLRAINLSHCLMCVCL